MPVYVWALARRLSPAQSAMIVRFSSGPLPPPRGRTVATYQALVAMGLIEPCLPSGPRPRLLRPRVCRLTKVGIEVAARIELAAAATLVPSHAPEPVGEPLAVS